VRVSDFRQSIVECVAFLGVLRKSPRPLFGELWQTPLRDLYAQAVSECLKDAQIERKQIESAWIGCMSSGLFNHQEHLASILSDYAGLNGIAATRVESACASGGAAFRSAYLEVASGASDFVIAGGVESMSVVPIGGHRYLPNPALLTDGIEAFLAMGLTAERLAEQGAKVVIAYVEADAGNRAADKIGAGLQMQQLVHPPEQKKEVNMLGEGSAAASKIIEVIKSLEVI